MYYIILFLGVLTVLALAAWLTSSRRHVLVRSADSASGQGIQAAHASGNFVAQLLQGERKEDKPCLTPIDCVKDMRCAGNCGCR